MAYCPSSVRGVCRPSPLRLRTTILRSQPAYISQLRSLWWWSRNSHSNLDDGEEERFLRSQRMIRHRYAKIVRRRAMWDREPTSHQWPWQRSGRSFAQQPQNVQRPNTNEPSGSQNQEKPDKTKQREPLISFHKDFDSFRRAVDRAMERDPYGTLFGRRLWSPPSPNNMSWTSFSWFADPKDMKDTPAASTQSQQPSHPNASANASELCPAKDENNAARASSSPAESSAAKKVNYIYDPISGRNVPETTGQTTTQKQSYVSQSSSNPAPQYTPDGPRKSFFETLFGENAVDIPVKTYEPKVYGYGTNEPPKKSQHSTTAVKNKPGFENSRKREFQALKAVTLGNTIDTTAEFGGKYKDPNEPPPINPTSSSEPPADAPLFSGTAYEGRVAAILSDSNKATWLEKEGFGAAVNSSTWPTSASETGPERIQPAIDRIQPPIAGKADHLQPALDRSSKIKGHTSSSEFKSTAAWQAKVDAAEKAEDIDLLRTSDVRAGIKSKRPTKQETEDRKSQTRQDLEKSFAAKQAENDEIAKPIVKSGLDHLRKHAESNPDGIVAKTMKSVGTLNETLQKYLQKSGAPEEASNLKADQDLQKASSTAAPATKPQECTEVPVSTIQKPKPHPLSEATVKEGVPRYPVIENHISNFEPRYIDLVYQMKNIRRELHASKLQLRHLRSVLQRKPWSELEAARLDEYAKSPLVEEDASASGFDEPIFSSEPKNRVSQAQPTATTSHDQQMPPARRDTGPKSLDEAFAPYQQAQNTSHSSNIEAMPESEPRSEPPVFTPAESPMWNDEQPPPIAELKATAIKDFTSPFVMLINNGRNGVRAVPAPNLPHLAGRTKINPFEILATLEQDTAAQFLAYFPRLLGAGYELVNGDANKLTFRKLAASRPQAAESEDAAFDKKAATVLDEMPAEIEPPGPSAPIAPPSANRLFDRKEKPQPPIRRQEEVFSGTTTAPARPIPAFNKQAATPPPSSGVSYSYDTQTPEPDFFAKLSRTFRRVTLTVIALAGGAYMIGFISEGVGAQTQAQRGAAGEALGPRKRIVLPVEDGEKWRRGTRPGIYSTESSR